MCTQKYYNDPLLSLLRNLRRKGFRPHLLINSEGSINRLFAASFLQLNEKLHLNYANLSFGNCLANDEDGTEGLLSYYVVSGLKSDFCISLKRCVQLVSNWHLMLVD